ncbi:MAG: MFS transporter [Bacteroidota bacterium]
MKNEKSEPVSIYPVLMVNFIGSLGYSIVLPFLIFLVTRFGGNEIIYGVLGSMYPLFQFFGAPILGKWSDAVGRKKILLLSQLGTLVAWTIFLIALFIPFEKGISIETSLIGTFSITIPLILIFFARALDGLTGGNISVANAYMSDISNDENRKKNFGKMSMSSSLGFIIGPAIAGLLGSTSLKEIPPIIGAMVISMIALYIIQMRLPESNCKSVKLPGKLFNLKGIFSNEHKECFEFDEGENDISKKTKNSVWNVKGVPFMVGYYFLVFLGFSFFYAAFPIHAMNKLGWTPFELGLFFSFLSGMMVLVQGPLLNALSDRFSEINLILTGSFFLVINFILMSSQSALNIYFGAIFFALGNGIMWPSYLSLLSQVGGKKHQGEVQGVANSGGSMASIFGLIFGGYFYSLIGGSTFILSAITLFIIFLVSFRFYKLKIGSA